jgi:uncharacterized protein YkwD
MSQIRKLLVQAVFALGLAALSGCDSGDLTGLTPEIDSDVGQFVLLMNEHRTSVGCGPLEWNVAVAVVAEDHSEDMVLRSFFAHTNPDGASPFDRLQYAGINYSGAAENIASGYPTAEAVLAGWLGSPGHRTNIENCSLTEHGVGLVESRWTHLFIRP